MSRAERRAHGMRGPKQPSPITPGYGVVSRHRTSLGAKRAVRRRNKRYRLPRGRKHAFLSMLLEPLGGWGDAGAPRQGRPCAAVYAPAPDFFPGRPYAAIVGEDSPKGRALVASQRGRVRLDALVGLLIALAIVLDSHAAGAQTAGVWTFLRQAISGVQTPGTGYSTLGIDTTSKLVGIKHDDGTVAYIRPDSVNSTINVLDPPYSADNTGATDATTALNAAITACSPGGIVFVPPGTYRIDGSLTVVNSHVQIIGASRGDCIFKTNSATANVLTFYTWYSSVQNIYFQTTPTRTAGYAVVMPTSGGGGPAGNTRHLMFNCQVDSYFNGVQMQSHVSSIDFCEFRTFANGGSWIEVSCAASSAHDLSISRLDTDNGSNGAGTAGILVTQCASLRLTDVNLTHGGANGALQINPGAGQVVPSIKAINSFFDNSGHGVNITGNATGTIQRIQFTNCWFSSSTNAGATLNSSNSIGIQGLDFVNCDFYANANGINALAGYQSWSVSGSRISGNTTTGILTTAVAGGSFGITDNFIGNGSGFGANGLGINIQAGTYTSYMVTGNWGLDSNTTKGITDAGTASVSKIVDSNQGDAMIAGGGASITASVAMAATPGNIPIKLAIPAGSLKVGSQLRIECWGIHAATAAGTIQGIVRLGTAGTTGDTSILTATAVGAATATTTWRFTALVTIVAVGASPTALCGTMSSSGTTFSPGLTTAATAIASYNTTTQAGFLSLNMVIAGTSPTGTVWTASVEVVKP